MQNPSDYQIITNIAFWTLTQYLVFLSLWRHNDVIKLLIFIVNFYFNLLSLWDKIYFVCLPS